MKVNNAAAMRDALEATRSLLLPQCNGGTAFAKSCVAACDKIASAIATPPRNCDIGTAEEQAERFGKMCGRYYHEEESCDKRCPLASSGFITGFPRCQAYWAQMPYKEGDGQ